MVTRHTKLVEVRVIICVDSCWSIVPPVLLKMLLLILSSAGTRNYTDTHITCTTLTYVHHKVPTNATIMTGGGGHVAY